MAEGIVVLSAIKTVVDVVRVCYNLVDDVQSVRGGLKELPKAFDSLRTVLPLIALTLEKTERRIAAGGLDEETCEALEPVIAQCHGKIQELQATLERLKPGKNASKWKVFGKAVYGLTQKKDFTTLAEEIMKYHVLIYQAGAIAPSPEEIGTITRRAQTSLDDSVQRMIEQLQQERPRLPPANSGLYIEQAYANSAQFYSNSNGNVTYQGPIQINQYFGVPNPGDTEHLNTPPNQFTNAIGPVRRPGMVLPMASQRAIRGNESPRSPETPLIEYESPREVDSIHDSWSEPTTYSTGSEYIASSPIIAKYPSYSSGRDNVVASPVAVKDPTYWDLQVIRDAVSDIRDAGQKLRLYPKLSEQLYLKAIRTLQSIEPSEPTVRVRKLRNMTASELGLTMVTRDRHDHIQKARAYNYRAYEAALESRGNGDVNRVKLDGANIKAREARMLERADANTTQVSALRREAIGQLHEVIDGLVGDCTNADDYDSLAQAYLGCSRLVGLHITTPMRMEFEQRRERTPEDYLRVALAAAERGLGLPALTAEEQEKLRATKNDIQVGMAKT